MQAGVVSDTHDDLDAVRGQRPNPGGPQART